MAAVEVALIKSLNGHLANHETCVKGLGLRHINRTVKVQDTPGDRSMINRAYYLLRVEGQSMQLNDLRSASGTHREKHRPGHGIGSGPGKASDRGHKGLTSRSGDKVVSGFEGGQQPLHRRLPRFGFASLKAIDRVEICISELTRVEGDVISPQTLKDADLINQHIQRVKVMLSGEVGCTVTLKGIAATRGARAAIEAAGGKFGD